MKLFRNLFKINKKKPVINDVLNQEKPPDGKWIELIKYIPYEERVNKKIIFAAASAAADDQKNKKIIIKKINKKNPEYIFVSLIIASTIASEDKNKKIIIKKILKRRKKCYVN